MVATLEKWFIRIMEYLIYQCCVCLELTSNAEKVTNRDSKKRQWITKLENVAPEVVWMEHYNICKSCTYNLEVAYEFRALCSRLHNVRQKILHLPIKENSQIRNANSKDQFTYKAIQPNEEIKVEETDFGEQAEMEVSEDTKLDIELMEFCEEEKIQTLQPLKEIKTEPTPLCDEKNTENPTKDDTFPCEVITFEVEREKEVVQHSIDQSVKEYSSEFTSADLSKISETEGDERLSCTPYEIAVEALATVSILPPEKSQDRYNQAYYHFKEWCKSKEVAKIDEKAVLLYFEEKSKITKSATLWSIYSMIKTTLKRRENVDISKYSKLLSFLKRKNVGYKPKKSLALHINQVNTFLKEARDEEFIAMKVALIMGVAGGCTSDELSRISIQDLQVKDDVIFVNLPCTKTGTLRQFKILEPNWISITKKYISMRPAELRHAALELQLPTKSKRRYERCYQVFVKWCDEKKFNNYTENVLLEYFAEMVTQNKKSLWALYSMLKSCIWIYKNIDISRYSKLLLYLKRKTADIKPKKSRVLNEEQINLFIDEADDNNFLLMKVALIIGVSGALRREELYKMVVSDVEFKTDVIIINISEATTGIRREFAITNSKWIAVVRKYLQIRLACSIKDRFFLKYQNGRCVNLPVGINAIGTIPSKIAKYLNLHDFGEYTGHCFRRTSATLLANRCGDMLIVKKQCGWKSYGGLREKSIKKQN